MSHSSSGQQGTFNLTQLMDVRYSTNPCFRVLGTGIGREIQTEEHGIYLLGFAALISLAIFRMKNDKIEDEKSALYKI